MNLDTHRVIVFAVLATFATSAAFAQAPSPAPGAASATDPAPQTAADEPAEATGDKPPEKPPAVDVLEVRGRNDALDVRRNSTASKIIITREDIQQFGDSSLADVMRRLPGVTQPGRPGRGGRPAMRGMGGGFTQILIDGQRIPPGFELDQIPPEQVERIEILRAPTAETGARAIAGTINIVLREPIRRTHSEVQLGVNEENGVFPANVSYDCNGTYGAMVTWNVNGNARLVPRQEEEHSIVRHTDLATGKSTLEQFFEQDNDNLFKGLFVNTRATWQLGRGEQFGLMAFAGAHMPHNTWRTTQVQTVGERPPQYAVREGTFYGRFAPSRLNLNLNRNLGPNTRYDLRAGLGRFRGEARQRTFDTLSDGTPGLVSSVDTESRDQSWNLSAKLMRTADEGKHNLVAGVEYESVERDQSSVTLNDGVPQLAALGEEFQVRTRRFAVYAQDEWDITEQWSVNFGLRYETIATTSVSALDDARNTSRVLTPLGHVLYRFGDGRSGRRDQIRLSLTQSYRSPTVEQLIARPWLNTTNPVPGPNTFSTPDSAGNVNLKPERANGIDLAYEYYFQNAGVLSANVFHRQIKDLIRHVTALENVSWATSPRYVTRPQNFSEAFSQGIEFDLKASLRDLIRGAPPVNVRMNASVFRSEVKDVPGPNNRINEQPRWTANIGGDYRIPGLGLQIGGNLAFTPGFTTQLTEQTAQTVNLKRVLDLFAVYHLNAQTKLRFTLSNLSAHPTESLNASVVDGRRIETFRRAQNYRNAGIRLEVRF